MLADATLPVPASLMTLLAGLAPLFTVVPHVLRPGLRFPRADREADGTRHAGRGKPAAAVAA
jgi:hypothetical protein